MRRSGASGHVTLWDYSWAPMEEIRMEVVGTEPPLWRLSRRLGGPIGLQQSTADGGEILLYAYQRGMPPQRSATGWAAFVPGSIGLLWSLIQYLRHRIRYRGQWVVEIKDSKSDEVLAQLIVPDRKMARVRFEAARDRCATVPAHEVSHVLEQHSDS